MSEIEKNKMVDIKMEQTGDIEIEQNTNTNIKQTENTEIEQTEAIEVDETPFIVKEKMTDLILDRINYRVVALESKGDLNKWKDITKLENEKQVEALNKGLSETIQLLTSCKNNISLNYYKKTYINTISYFLFQAYPNAMILLKKYKNSNDKRNELSKNCNKIIELVYEKDFPIASYLLKRTLSVNKSEKFKIYGPTLSEWEKSKAQSKIKRFSNLFGIFASIGFHQFEKVQKPQVALDAITWIKHETDNIVEEKLKYFKRLLKGKSSYDFFLVGEFQDFIYLMEKTMFYGSPYLMKRLNHQRDVIITIVPVAFTGYEIKQNNVVLESVIALLNDSHMETEYNVAAFVAKEIFIAMMQEKQGIKYDPSSKVLKYAVQNTLISFEINLLRTCVIFNDQWEIIRDSKIGRPVYKTLQKLANKKFVNGKLKTK